MWFREYIINNEKVFIGKKDIKYIFNEGENSDKLIVTFPGFASRGIPPRYNYIRTLMGCNSHKLFILDDYGPRGSYLIGENRDHSIEESVMSLIFSLCKKHNIKPKNVILQGSSKGGSCALYFGIKYGFGYVIAGAPQINLGDYLDFIAPEVAEYIAGGTSKEEIDYLNSLINDLIDISQKFPKIFIHVGKNDWHYKGHIIPFLEKLDLKGIKCVINTLNYSSHTSLNLYYPVYLLKTLNYIDSSIITPYPPIINTNIVYDDGFLKVSCDAEGDDLLYACYFFRGDNVVEKIFYQKDPFFRYPVNSNGVYRARVYVREGSEINYEYTDEIIIKNHDFNTNIVYNGGFLKVSCDAEGDDLLYACYFFRGDNVVEKIFYQKDPFFRYPVNSNGVYRARVYVREGSEINYEYTDEIIIDDSNFPIK